MNLRPLPGAHSNAKDPFGVAAAVGDGVVGHMVQERFGSQKSFIRNGIRAVPIPPRVPAIEEGVLQLADGMCLKSFCVLKGLQDFFERLGKPRGLITSSLRKRD